MANINPKPPPRMLPIPLQICDLAALVSGSIREPVPILYADPNKGLEHLRYLILIALHDLESTRRENVHLRKALDQASG